MYGVTRFTLRMWPGGVSFKHTLWWSEANIPHRYGAAYFVKFERWRGAAMYAGIREKGFEDRGVAAHCFWSLLLSAELGESTAYKAHLRDAGPQQKSRATSLLGRLQATIAGG